MNNNKTPLGFILSDETYPNLLDNINLHNKSQKYDVFKYKKPSSLQPRKIIGFYIISFPEFKEEILNYEDIQNLNIHQIKTLGLDVFIDSKETYLMPMLYDDNDIIEHNIDLYMLNINNQNDILIQKSPNNILLYLNHDLKQIWNLIKSNYMFTPAYMIQEIENQPELIINNYHDNLEIHVVPNIGTYIIALNNNCQVLWSNINPNIYNIYDVTYGKPYYNTLISKYVNYVTINQDIKSLLANLIIETKEFFMINKTVILKKNIKHNDILKIPNCETFIARNLDLCEYKQVYFPDNIKSIITKIDFINHFDFENTVFYFNKNTLKNRCINYMFEDSIDAYYSKYVHDQAYIEIPDEFKNATYLNDAISILKCVPVKIKFI